MKVSNFFRRKNRVRNKVKASNKSSRPRVVVFRSNKNFYAQLVDDFNNGLVLASASSLSGDLRSKKDIKGVEIAALVGETFAKSCIEKNVKDVIFDKGAYLYNGRVKSFVESCRKNGLKF